MFALYSNIILGQNDTLIVYFQDQNSIFAKSKDYSADSTLAISYSMLDTSKKNDWIDLETATTYDNQGNMIRRRVYELDSLGSKTKRLDSPFYSSDSIVGGMIARHSSYHESNYCALTISYTYLSFYYEFANTGDSIYSYHYNDQDSILTQSKYSTSGILLEQLSYKLFIADKKRLWKRHGESSYFIDGKISSMFVFRNGLLLETHFWTRDE